MTGMRLSEFGTASPYTTENAAQAARAAPATRSAQIAFHERHVPGFVDAALHRLYGSIYSTLGMFRMDGSIASANTYVASAGDDIRALFLYRREKGRVTVLNGGIRLDPAAIEQFAHAVFARYPRVSAIVFNNIQADKLSQYPFQQYYSSQDLIVTLPATPAAYLASLGKNLRETIKRYSNRLARSHPSFRFHVYVNDEADEQQIRDLYRLQRARIESKNKVSTVTDDEIERVLALVRTCGLVTIATIGGRVCGGMVCWRAGDNYFMRNVAHDPQYDDAKLGTLCTYKTICECIARGGKHFHFSPGRLIYKYRFLGVEHHYDQLVLYRSRWHRALSCGLVLKTALRGKIREVKLWLLDAEIRDDRTSRNIVTAMHAWRAFKSAHGIGQRMMAAKAALARRGELDKKIISLAGATREASIELLARRQGNMPQPANTAATDDNEALAPS